MARLYFRDFISTLTELYINAFESLLTEKLKDDGFAYLVIDLTLPRFNVIGEMGKRQILEHFRMKYGVPVYNESERNLKDSGLANKFGDLVIDDQQGLLLGIYEGEISRESAILEGYWMGSGIYGRGAIIYMSYQDNSWKVDEVVWTWVS